MPVPPWEEEPTTSADEQLQAYVSPEPTDSDTTGAVVPQEDGGDVDGGSGKVFPDNIHRSRDRKKKQHLRAKYSAIREEAQLAGVIPTIPEGGIRNEVVDPKTQSEQVFPSLVGGAIRKGWAVPEEKKPKLVDEMIDIVEDTEATTKEKVAAFNALRLADQQQYERDHPEEIAKKGGTSSVSVQANVQAVTVIREMIESGQIGHIEDIIATNKTPKPLSPPTTVESTPVEIKDSNEETPKETEATDKKKLSEDEIEKLLAPMRGVNRK